MLATTSNIKSIVIFIMLMIVINNTIYFNTGNLQILTALVCKPCYQYRHHAVIKKLTQMLPNNLPPQSLNLWTKSYGFTI